MASKSTEVLNGAKQNFENYGWLTQMLKKLRINSDYVVHITIRVTFSQASLQLEHRKLRGGRWIIIQQCFIKQTGNDNSAKKISFTITFLTNCITTITAPISTKTIFVRQHIFWVTHFRQDLHIKSSMKHWCRRSDNVISEHRSGTGNIKKKGCQTTDKIRQLSWAWFSCLRKLAK